MMNEGYDAAVYKITQSPEIETDINTSGKGGRYRYRSRQQLYALGRSGDGWSNWLRVAKEVVVK